MRRRLLIPRKKRYAGLRGPRLIELQTATVQAASSLPTPRPSPLVTDATDSFCGPELGQKLDPDLPALNHNQLDSKHSAMFGKTPDPLAEFDEYGTELHKDARVWKVYVEEADKHDTELVNGWNESTDVILIFAALFSAISTAFLIESSKLLQPDPAEQSAQSLLAISQTLSAIVNGTQSPGSIPSPFGDPVEFTPSRAAIWVNALWYLSLGLSLATSFIAILAKDWCHSFMSGRTGHPHSQMCRRQRKWNMIEKWKMSELLAILPSLIHLALLLFSVGLCIYLSDTYLAVAIPIFCATGVAIVFYVWSSIAAVSIDYFPYPTIISRACRTQVAHDALQVALSLGYRLGSHPVIRNLYQIVLALTLVFEWIIIIFLLVLWAGCKLFKKLKGPLDRCDRYLAQSPPLLQLVAVPFWKPARFLIWYPTNAAHDWIEKLGENLRSFLDATWSRLLGARWGSDWPDWVPQTVSQASDEARNQGNVTYLALSWLIINCEVPQSVDIALQSIAGVTGRTSRQPLLDCHATLEILRRLASSNLYKGSDARTNMIISLYSRALMRLGGAGPGAEQGAGESELEGMIWDVHLGSERSVASLIVSGRFDLTPANLEALRIGNTAASITLKLLGRDSQKADIDIDKVLGSIAARLQAHVSKSEPLHAAALISLVNAVALLLPFAPDSSTAASLGSLCLRVIGYRLDAHEPSDLLLVNLAFVCASTFRESTDPGLLGNQNSRSLLQDVVGRLVECYTEDTSISRMRSMFGLDTLATCPEAFGLSPFDLGVQDSMLNIAASTVQVLNHSFLVRYQGRTGAETPEDSILKSLRTLRSPLSLLPVEPSRTSISFLILGPIRRLWGTTLSPIAGEWAKLASDSRFPTLSRTLIQSIAQSDLITYLELIIDKSDSFGKFVALGQLWLLFTVYLGASNDLQGEWEQLGTHLKSYKQSRPESEHDRHTQIGDQLVRMWESENILSAPLGGWPARLMECVHQSRNSPLPKDVYDILQRYNVLDNLRGLSSFTSWRPHSIEAETGDMPLPMSATHAVGNDESGDDAPVQKISGATVVGGTGEGEVAGHTSPGDDQRVTHETIGPENLAHGMPDGGKEIEGEGNPTTSKGKEQGDTGSRTDHLAVEYGDSGNGADVGPHVSIDLHALETASM